METLHQIVFDDAANMASIDPNTIHLVITSPPYPMIEMWDDVFSQSNGLVTSALDDGNGDLAFNLMHLVLDKVWEEVERVLCPGGLACINIGDATRTLNGEFRLFPNHARIITAFQKLGCGVLPAIIWRKPTNAPNKFMGSGMLPPNAYVTLEHEYILIFRKRGKRLLTEAEAKRLRYQSAYFWEERNQWFSDVWFDLRGSGQTLKFESLRSRSAAFPVELPHRLINMFSIKKDVILDPFLGTGSTMLAAMCAGRSSIGFEIDQAFQPLILQNISKVPELSRKAVEQRLSSHIDFTNDRLGKGGVLKHRNMAYDLPVITKQEEALTLDLAGQVEFLSDDKFKVRYQKVLLTDLPKERSVATIPDNTPSPQIQKSDKGQMKLF